MITLAHHPHALRGLRLISNQQIYQVQEPPTPRLQTEDKPHGGHDRGRDGTNERTFEGD